MSSLPIAGELAPLFRYHQWNAEVSELSRLYRGNRPIQHILLKDFIDPTAAYEIAEEFPGPSTQAWTQYKHRNENKLGMAKRDLFPPRLGELADDLNSPRFMAWLSKLTGIPGLMADPSLEGGGLHQSSRGGFLNVHTDFSHHHYHKGWRRRINLILYLNPQWKAEWGGAIELWDVSMQRCVVKYQPFLNHALIFNTDERSLHGFPDPLTCPKGMSRKSLALYYYTVDGGSRVSVRSTDYRARPTDSRWKSALIWADKKAVHWYSRAKARFGFSDDLASRILGRISGKNGNLE